MYTRALSTLLISACSITSLFGQTNLQLFYDFGSDRKQITATLEMFKADKWGSTFLFVDQDFRTRTRDHHPSLSAGNEAPCGTYFEISRALNLWQQSVLSPLSLHVEYNGGVYDQYYVNNAWLLGAEWFIHTANFKNTLTLQVLYKSIAKAHSDIPMQLTAVWGADDFLGLRGLRFSGFIDFWWQDHVAFAHSDFSQPVRKSTTILAEPQLWYNIGRHVGCDNLHIGTEIELTNNFATYDGFKCNPCVGFKWVF